MKTQIIIALLAFTLVACTPSQANATDVQNTAVANVLTGVSLTQTALPTATPLPPNLAPTATIV